MKKIWILTVLLGTMLLGDEETRENKYLYFSNASVSSIDISCKKDDDCVLTRQISKGCDFTSSINKKTTQKEIIEFNNEEAIFWITKSLDCSYPEDERVNKFIPKCHKGTCTLGEGNVTYTLPPPHCGMDRVIDALSKKKESSKWKKLKHGLWQDRDGNIGLKTSKALNESEIVDRYITTMGAEGKKLKDTLDISTFESVKNSSYYKDKNHVYLHYSMSDGGWFAILEGADSLTFGSIGGIYFKDKEHIYVERNGKIYVDYDTFEAFETVGDVCCYAKDKNAYYEWGRKVEDVKSSVFLQIKKILGD